MKPILFHQVSQFGTSVFIKGVFPEKLVKKYNVTSKEMPVNWNKPMKSRMQ
jgi:hypothetical protein